MPNPHVLVEGVLVGIAVHQRDYDERSAEDFDEESMGTLPPFATSV